LLLFLSLFSGFLFKNIFIGLSSDFFIMDIYTNPIQKQRFFESKYETSSNFNKNIPFIMTIYFFLFFIILILF
jgi:hypothetical protein